MSYEDLSSEKNEEQQEKLLDDLKKLDALSDKVLATRIIKLCDSDDYIAVPSGLTHEELVLWLSTDHEKE